MVNQMVMQKEDKQEGVAIVDWIVNRIKRGLGVNIIVVGPPGLGKSYTCLRIMELVYERLHGEKLTNPKHIVNDIHDAFKFVRNVKRAGEPLTIEEVSVLASSRRSMASDNVSLNYLLDTVRKKQVVLLMNAPHIKSVDTHIKRLSHLMIECLRVNKREKFATIKALKLQTNQHTGKVYLHRFVSNTGKDIHRSYFFKPSHELTDTYEEQKDNFMGNLYQLMEAKGEKKKAKERKEAGILPEREIIEVPSEIESRRWHMRQKGMMVKDIAKIEGVGPPSITKSVASYEKKTKPREVQE